MFLYLVLTEQLFGFSSGSAKKKGPPPRGVVAEDQFGGKGENHELLPYPDNDPDVSAASSPDTEQLCVSRSELPLHGTQDVVVDVEKWLGFATTSGGRWPR
jgi:hypothetical protein